MNPVTFHFASGLALFSGAALLVLSLLVLGRATGRWLCRLRALLAWMALALMLLSATPFPLWCYLVLGALFLAWLVLSNTRAPRRWNTPALKTGITVSLITVALGLVSLEAPHLVVPTLPPVRAGRLYVLGDSLSSGISNAPPWPDLYAAANGVRVTNLSRAGYDTADALGLPPQVTDPDSIVLVELGGNDLLAYHSPAEFARNLDQLLAQLRPRTRAVVMMELPLIPTFNAYGRAQRQLARKHGVYLVPKRILVDVLAAPGSLDGLHLGPAGAQRMVTALTPILEPGLRRSK